jgi:hypothetical protein
VLLDDLFLFEPVEHSLSSPGHSIDFTTTLIRAPLERTRSRLCPGKLVIRKLNGAVLFGHRYLANFPTLASRIASHLEVKLKATIGQVLTGRVRGGVSGAPSQSAGPRPSLRPNLIHRARTAGGVRWFATRPRDSGRLQIQAPKQARRKPARAQVLPAPACQKSYRNANCMTLAPPALAIWPKLGAVREAAGFPRFTQLGRL